MRIAYHSDSFAKRARFGLSRYSHSLRNALVADSVETIPFSSMSDYPAGRPDWLVAAGFKQLRVPRRIMAPVWTVAGFPLAEWLLPPFDLLHSIDVDYRAPTAKPWVVTIHDLGPLVHPEFFSNARPWLLRSYVRQIAERADRILCVSQSTADEISHLAGRALGDRLIVTSEGVDATFFDPVDAGVEEEVDGILGSSAPFFLFSGSMNPRKNVERTLDAFMRLGEEFPHRLVLVGHLGWDSCGLQQKLEAARATGRVLMPGYVSDDILRGLLRRATAYLYPSLYEGFGLPILEAMAAGCPVVAGNNSSMPEVAGDAAILVDATSELDIERAIRTLANDADYANWLAKSGIVRARQFTWKGVSDQTISIYKSLI